MKIHRKSCLKSGSEGQFVERDAERLTSRGLSNSRLGLIPENRGTASRAPRDGLESQSTTGESQVLSEIEIKSKTSSQFKEVQFQD